MGLLVSGANVRGSAPAAEVEVASAGFSAEASATGFLGSALSAAGAATGTALG